MPLSRHAACGALMLLAGCQATQDAVVATALAPLDAAQGAPTLASVDADMAELLLALQALAPQPLETLSPEEARQQPTMADGVRKFRRDRGEDASPQPVEIMRETTIPGPSGPLTVRVYTPYGATRGALPVVLYFHGGGWVIGDSAAYDASQRAIANWSGAIVVGVEYRLAPEHPFPSAHEDALAAYAWVRRNARSIGGDSSRVAVAGEGAGGNLALATALAAGQHGLRPPAHIVAIHPIAGADPTTASYVANADAKPVGRATMDWFLEHYLIRPDDAHDPRVDLVHAHGLDGLGPTTLVLAEIDPLRFEGEELGRRLRDAGVPVEVVLFEGVTQDFFGTAPIVAKAVAAQTLVGERLRASLAKRS